MLNGLINKTVWDSIHTENSDKQKTYEIAYIKFIKQIKCMHKHTL